MKKIIQFITLLLLFFCLTFTAKSQHAISIDAGYIKNFHNDLNGLDISSVLYFNKKWAMAFEINRFFAAKRIVNNEEEELSALDFDLNLHRYFNLSHKLRCYPIVGISHTSEKEVNQMSKDVHHINFFSANTGGGFVYELSKRWHPAIEFTYAWAKEFNQQFLLVNVAYEIDFKNKKSDLHH
jgi:hypothetical protein